MDTIYARMVAHLSTLAQHPGWLDYAKARSIELEACESGLWQGLRDAVQAELGRAKATASVAQSATKPR
jgi:hypothetical protein